MSNGGYALLKWQPDKKVFIDTYFAPHPDNVLNDYYMYCRQPDKLEGVCETALVSVSEMYILKKFAKSKLWHPEVIGISDVLFSTENKTPTVLLNKDEVDGLTKIQRDRFEYVLNLLLKKN